ncbi:glycine cleavage system protein H [candidate division KSB3 bacterium]|uniref:Glycine cleavage system H protein n=1 Tax=candidate division KSB3 bacterium TaxID=2044937 RepID=A0A2G6KLC6_9BACT|nr:MAG: glycine cleavage system protein H [candidate division KSB3 bacterium]
MCPEELLYSKDHEWVKINDGTAVVGITNYAQEQLGDVVYVELPEVGSQVTQFEVCGTIESVKTVSDLYSPLSGEIVAINESLDDAPELINNEPYGKGWIIEMTLRAPEETGQLLSAAAYEELIQK